MKGQRHNKIFFIILMLVSTSLWSQQLPYLSAIHNNQGFFNPASYDDFSDYELDLFFRKQWIGFAGSPLLGNLRFTKQLPDKHLILGFQLNVDRAGVLSKTVGSFNGAYALNSVLGDQSRVSVGLSLGGLWYALSKEKFIANNSQDPLFQGSSSSIQPTIGIGFDYKSNIEDRSSQSLNISIAYNQLNESDVLLQGSNQKRVGHFFGMISTRLPFEDNGLTPSISFNYVDPEQIQIMLNAVFDINDHLWFGMGYSNVNDVNLQGGFKREDHQGRFTKIGILFNTGLLNDIQNFTPGFELSFKYGLSLD
jgi:type IX secretion system PorP/SprF family membrane protein